MEGPFKGELEFTKRVGQSEFSNVLGFKDNDEWVVKAMKRAYDVNDGKPKVIGQREWEISSEQAALEIQKDVNLCKEHLGEFLPLTQVIIGDDKHPYIVQKRINNAISLGEAYQKDSEELDLYKEEIDDFGAAALKMFLDTYDPKSGVGRFPDLEYLNGNVLLSKYGTDISIKKLSFIDVHPLPRASVMNLPSFFMNKWILPLKQKGLTLTKTEEILSQIKELRENYLE